jgi:hypothetical protein
MTTQPTNCDHALCPCCHVRSEISRAAPGWHDRKGPTPVLRALHGLRRYGLPSWVDHPYRIHLPDDRWQYVAEPYSLFGSADDIDHLRANGFDVQVSKSAARHFPGRTVAIVITPRRDAPMRRPPTPRAARQRDLRERICAWCRQVIPERLGVYWAELGIMVHYQSSCNDNVDALRIVYDRSPRGRMRPLSEVRAELDRRREAVG